MKKLLLFLLVISQCSLLSQESVGIPPSPSVSSLVTVKKDSVNSSGSIAHSIPLWKMKLGNNEFPVALTYSSSGIKVEEISSNVGLGWNLSAGGVITRSVLDLPDDIMNNTHGKGILHTDVLNDIETFESAVTTNGYDEATAKAFFKNDINETTLDTHNDSRPDIFYFNFFDIQGKFVFNKHKEIVSLSNDNFKYSYTLDSSDQLESFIITDTRGIKYIFATKEMSTTTFYSGKAWEFLSNKSKRQQVMTFSSAWHLSQVITEFETLNFTYDTAVLEYQLNNAEMGKICYEEQCENVDSGGNLRYDILNGTEKSTTDYDIDSKVIKEITSDCFSITFNNSSRLDLNGGLKTDRIIIKDHNDVIVMEYDLVYSYLQSTPSDESDSFEEHRLMLNSVKKNNHDMETFSYYDDYQLPNRTSCEQDFWGYYNANNATSLVPKVYAYFENQIPKHSIFPPLTNETVYSYGTVDRNVNPSTVHMGMLKKIEYRTGGSKTFYYEPNDFTHQEYTTGNDVLKGNGVRVKTIAYFDGQNTEQYNYSYTSPTTGISSGKISYLPNFFNFIPWNFTYSKHLNAVVAYSPKSTFAMQHFQISIYDEENGTWSTEDCKQLVDMEQLDYSPTNEPEKFLAMGTRRYATTQLELSTNISTPIVYSTIKIDEGNNGYKLYHYNTLGALGESIPQSYSSSLFEPRPSFKTNFWNLNFGSQGQHPGNSNCHHMIMPLDGMTYNAFNEYLQYLDLSGASQPYAPKPNWNKQFGILQDYEYYNQTGERVFKQAFEYELQGNLENASTTSKIIGIKYRLFDRPINLLFTNPGTGFNITSAPTAWIWSFYDIYYQADLVPTKTITTKYFSSGNQNTIVETNFEYEFPSLLTAKSYTNSKGQVISEKYKYTIHFKEAGNVYDRMIAQNNIMNNIEIIYQTNQKVVNAIIHEYTDGPQTNGYTFLKVSDKSLKTNRPLTDYVEYNSSHITDSRVDTDVIYDAYNNKGEIIEYHKPNGIKTYLLRGYKNKLVIASIEGVDYSLLPNSTKTLMQSISDLSNLDNTEATEAHLRTELNKLRLESSLQGTRITTYTYDPFVGVTSITDNRENTKYYSYDDFNRLEYIKDHDGNVLEEFKYNYKQ